MLTTKWLPTYMVQIAPMKLKSLQMPLLVIFFIKNPDWGCLLWNKQVIKCVNVITITLTNTCVGGGAINHNYNIPSDMKL